MQTEVELYKGNVRIPAEYIHTLSRCKLRWNCTKVMYEFQLRSRIHRSLTLLSINSYI